VTDERRTDPRPAAQSAIGPITRRGHSAAVRWTIRAALALGLAAAAVAFVADDRRADRALAEAEAVPADGLPERGRALRAVVRRHPFSTAAQHARAELRLLGRLPAGLSPLSPYRVNYAVAFPAAIAVLLAGTALLTDWGRRRVPGLLSLLALLASGTTLLGQFDAITLGLSRLLGAPTLLEVIVTTPTRPIAWGFAAIGLCLVYLEKRHHLHGQFAPWEIEKFLPSRRSWALLGVGGLCAVYTLLALRCPVQVGRWEVHAAVLSPLLAGVLLGGKRGTLAQAAAALALAARPGRFAGSFISAETALKDPEFVFLLGFIVVPAVVSAALTERRHYAVGWTFLALVEGVVVLYAGACGALLIGHAVLPAAGGSVRAALSVFAHAAIPRLPGDAGMLVAALGVAYVVGLPTRIRRRREKRAAALQRIENEQPACELLVLTGVTHLLEQEHDRLRQRSAGREDDPLVARLRDAFDRLRQSVATRVSRLERHVPEAERAAATRRLLTPWYLQDRLRRMLETLRVFRTGLPDDTDETRPDLKGALDRVGRYFGASTGGTGTADEGSRDERLHLALRLKREMEADYRRRAKEVSTLADQAENLAADLKALRRLWRDGVVSTALWSAQQPVFARLLRTTHRQIDLRRRVLSIYRRADPPLDLA